MNKSVISVTRFVAVSVIGLSVAACEAEKSSNPLSPSVAGPIPGVEVSAPRLVEPEQGFKFKEKQQPIKLVIENAGSSGVRPLTYLFEVASDTEFNNKVFARSGVSPGENGRTSVLLEALELGRAYYWRVRAEDGANMSVFSTAQFEVLPRASLSTPTPVSPINNERLSNRRPTLWIYGSDRNSAVGAVTYFFVIAKDQAFTQLAATGTADETTNWTPGHDLDANMMHYWRVRASDGEVTTDWSATQQFTTAAAAGGGGGGGGGGPTGPSPCSGGGRTPNPAPGQRLPAPNMAHVVQWVAQNYPGALANSCQSHGGTWEFMDRVVDELRKCDTRWGYNGKRGNANDPSHDVVAYNWGSQPDQGTTDVYIFDIIVGHCGSNPGAAWGDITGVGGALGRWISRGRF